MVVLNNRFIDLHTLTISHGQHSNQFTVISVKQGLLLLLWQGPSLCYYTPINQCVCIMWWQSNMALPEGQDTATFSLLTQFPWQRIHLNSGNWLLSCSNAISILETSEIHHTFRNSLSLTWKDKYTHNTRQCLQSVRIPTSTRTPISQLAFLYFCSPLIEFR